MQPVGPKTFSDEFVINAINDIQEEEITLQSYGIHHLFGESVESVTEAEYPFFLDRVFRFRLASEANETHFMDYFDFLIDSSRIDEAIKLFESYSFVNETSWQRLLYCHLLNHDLESFSKELKKFELAGFRITLPEIMIRHAALINQVHRFIQEELPKQPEHAQIVQLAFAERYAEVSCLFTDRLDSEGWIVWMCHAKSHNREEAESHLDVLVNQATPLPYDLQPQIIDTLIDVNEIDETMLEFVSCLADEAPSNPNILRLCAVWHAKKGLIKESRHYEAKLLRLRSAYPSLQMDIQIALLFKQKNDSATLKALLQDMWSKHHSKPLFKKFLFDHYLDLPVAFDEKNLSEKNVYEVVSITKKQILNDKKVQAKHLVLLKQIIKSYPYFTEARECSFHYNIELKKYDEALEDLKVIYAEKGASLKIFILLSIFVYDHKKFNEVKKIYQDIEKKFGKNSFYVARILNVFLELQAFDEFLEIFSRRYSQNEYALDSFVPEITSRLDQFKRLDLVPRHPKLAEIILWRAKKTLAPEDIEFLKTALPNDPDVLKLQGSLKAQTDLTQASSTDVVEAAPFLSAEKALEVMKGRGDEEIVEIYKSLKLTVKKELEIAERAFKAFFNLKMYSEALEAGKELSGITFERGLCHFYLGRVGLAKGFLAELVKAKSPKAAELTKITGINLNEPAKFIISSESKKRVKREDSKENWDDSRLWVKEKDFLDPYIAYQRNFSKHRIDIQALQREEALVKPRPSVVQAVVSKESLPQESSAKAPPLPKVEVVTLKMGETEPKVVQENPDIERLSPPIESTRISPLPSISLMDNKKVIDQMILLIQQAHIFIDMHEVEMDKLFEKEFQRNNLIYYFVKTFIPLKKWLQETGLNPGLLKNVDRLVNELAFPSFISNDKLLLLFKMMKDCDLVGSLKVAAEKPDALNTFDIQFFTLLDKSLKQSTENNLEFIRTTIKSLYFFKQDLDKKEWLAIKIEYYQAMKGAILLVQLALSEKCLPKSIVDLLLKRLNSYVLYASNISMNFKPTITTLLGTTYIEYEDVPESLLLNMAESAIKDSALVPRKDPAEAFNYLAN